MRTNISVFIALLILFSSCQDEVVKVADQDLNAKEIALLKKENDLLRREKQLKEAADSLAELQKMVLKDSPNKKVEAKTKNKRDDDAWTAPAEHGETDHLWVRKGKHNFTLQWLGFDKPGTVIIDYLGEGEYSIEGEQRNKNGYVTIQGTFSTISKKELRFNGKIITQVTHNNAGKPCIKKGTYKFLATGKRKYYRLQDMKNCEGGMLVDYVDIFF